MEPQQIAATGTSTASEPDRRDFVKRMCVMAAAAVGLPSTAADAFAQTVLSGGRRPSVIWLSFQECTGCTESLLRTSHPQLDELILDLISLDYHEALSVPSGHLAEEARHAAMEENAGSYILVVEGSIPTKDGGVYCMVGNQTALEIVEEAAENAGAIVAIGSCAAWGGIPSSPPNPTGATGAPQILTDRTVVALPGCPPNPYNLLGTVLQYATYGTLPELDEKGRPVFAYGRVIHEDCPRRPHFDAGRFARQFGDPGHKDGWCLYYLGCKGPQTAANCSIQQFNEMPGSWPIGAGHPCFGCTEESLAFKVALHDTVPIINPTPFATAPSPDSEIGSVSPLAVGVAAAVAGAAIGGGAVAATRLGQEDRSGRVVKDEAVERAKEQEARDGAPHGN